MRTSSTTGRAPSPTKTSAVLSDVQDENGQGYSVNYLLANAWPTTILYDENLEVLVAPGNPNSMDFYAPLIELEEMLASGSL